MFSYFLLLRSATPSQIFFFLPLQKISEDSLSLSHLHLKIIKKK